MNKTLRDLFLLYHLLVLWCLLLLLNKTGAKSVVPTTAGHGGRACGGQC